MRTTALSAGTATALRRSRESGRGRGGLVGARRRRRDGRRHAAARRARRAGARRRGRPVGAVRGGAPRALPRRRRPPRARRSRFRSRTTRSTRRSPSSSSTSWPTPRPGSREMRRVIRPGGVVAACCLGLFGRDDPSADVLGRGGCARPGRRAGCRRADANAVRPRRRAGGALAADRPRGGRGRERSSSPRSTKASTTSGSRSRWALGRRVGMQPPSTPSGRDALQSRVPPAPLRPRRALPAERARMVRGREGVAGALLVGGASTRFGSPKALARYQGEMLAARAHRVLTDAFERVIVVGKAADGLELPLPGARRRERRPGGDRRRRGRAPPGRRRHASSCSRPTCLSWASSSCSPWRRPPKGRRRRSPRAGPLPGAYGRSALPVLEQRIAAGDFALYRAC